MRVIFRAIFRGIFREIFSRCYPWYASGNWQPKALLGGPNIGMYCNHQVVPYSFGDNGEGIPDKSRHGRRPPPPPPLTPPLNVCHAPPLSLPRVIMAGVDIRQKLSGVALKLLAFERMLTGCPNHKNQRRYNSWIKPIHKPKSRTAGMRAPRCLALSLFHDVAQQIFLGTYQRGNFREKNCC